MGRDPIRDPPWKHDHSDDYQGGAALNPDSIAYDLDADTRKLIWQADYPESGYSGFASYFSPTDFNGTTDPILGWGWNFNQDGNRQDSNDAALGWQLEPRFNNGTQNITELFMKGYKSGGSEFRPFQSGYYHTDDNFDAVMTADRSIRWDFTGLSNRVTMLKAHDPGNGTAQFDTTAGKWVYSTPNGTQRWVHTGGNWFINTIVTLANHGTSELRARDSGGTDHEVVKIDAGDDLVIGDGALPVDTRSAGEKMAQRAADPGTGELASGEVMRYVSDGSSDCTGAAGDLVYAINDAGTIKTQVIAAASNAT